MNFFFVTEIHTIRSEYFSRLIIVTSVFVRDLEFIVSSKPKIILFYNDVETSKNIPPIKKKNK